MWRRRHAAGSGIGTAYGVPKGCHCCPSTAVDAPRISIYNCITARASRIVVPGLPHHVTQRGNRREPIFFEPGDHEVYLRILAAQTRRRAVEVWAYCLMPNHVHLIMTPSDSKGLSLAVGETHRLYALYINRRALWIGHLFQARFASVVMDERHLIVATRYVSLNPVRAGLVQRADDWLWSSVRAHLSGCDDGIVRVEPMLSRIERFADILETPPDDPAFAALRVAENNGRPLGDPGFLAMVHSNAGRRC